MASDESMSIRSCISMQEDNYDDDDDDDDDIDDAYHRHHHHTHPHPHNLSRLSTCTSGSIYGNGAHHYDHIDDGNYNCQHQDQPQHENGMSTYMSLLSMESFDGDIDEETLWSNDVRPKRLVLEPGLSSDSDMEPGLSSDSDMEPALSTYSLPATPPTPRAQAAAGGMLHFKHPNPMLVKEYASENEAQTVMSHDHSKSRRRRRSRMRIMKNRHSWLSASSDRGTLANKKDGDDDEDEDEDEGNKERMNMMRIGNNNNQLGHYHSFSGESEGGTGSATGTGLVVITRPKGGSRSLCMDLEEVKACRDLGFELEHQHMLQEMPSRLSLSASTLDTNTTCSSGGDSPIANWRISSPGDDPREVKARLKVWAQAVALASTTRQGS